MSNSTDINAMLALAGERRARREAGARAKSRNDAALDGSAARYARFKKSQWDGGGLTPKQARRVRPFRREARRLGVSIDETKLRAAARLPWTTPHADLRVAAGLPAASAGGLPA